MARLAWIGAIALATGCVTIEISSVEGDGSTGAPPGLPSGPGEGGSEASTHTPEGTTGSPSDPLTETTTSYGELVNTDEGGSSSSAGAPVVPDPVACGAELRQCGDGIDNDGDGLFDNYDPECSGPCDDDEGSFEMDLPGEGTECARDCAFDGNADDSDDRCHAFLPCDDENPGAELGCPYDPPQNCHVVNPPSQSDSCLEACLPLVPPGCDCFGCCVLDSDDVEIAVFMGSGDACRRDNLGACQSCTPSENCINDCDPDCELCFGTGGPVPNCERETPCPGDPCTGTEDCPVDYACYLGCCYPPPPAD